MLKEILESNITNEEKNQQLSLLPQTILADEFIKLDDKRLAYRILDNETLANIISYMDEEDAAEIMADFDLSKTTEILNIMPEDDAADIIPFMDDEEQEKVLELVDDDIKELLSYDENETGSIMSMDYIEIDPNDDVKDAMKKVRAKASEIEFIDTLFVVKNRALLGVLDLKKLIVTKSPAIISDIMDVRFEYANVHDDVEKTINKIKDYDLNTIAVLDNDNMVGIVTVDDAMDTYTEEFEDDYAKFSGLTEQEDSDESTFESIKKRIPWLVILLILDFFVAMVISRFEHVIESLTILVSFQPVILGLSGNAGTQSLAISVRSVANDEVTAKEQLRHIFKELLTGALLGMVIGIGVFIVILIFLNIKGGDINIIRTSLVVASATLIALTVSSFVGALFPILLNKMRIDPAVASGPFITTINDVVAILIYFTLASIFLLQM